MKKNLRQIVERTDASNKANPLDLSSDQDLTIALMNLVAIEDIAPDSPVGQMVTDVRQSLMAPMAHRAAKNGADADEIRGMLVQAMRDMKTAEQAQLAGDNQTAYDMYNRAYESYVLYLAGVYGISA